MEHKDQVETVIARMNDCQTADEIFATVRMFMEDPIYTDAAIKEGMRNSGATAILKTL